MTVEINFLNFGSLGPASFADSMAVGPPNPRNVISPPSESWYYIPLGGDTPTAGAALPAFAFGSPMGGGGFGCQINDVSYAFTTYNFAAGIMPVVMGIGSRYYKAQQKFVQYQFNSQSQIVFDVGIGNFIDATGVGVAGSSAICHDAYTLDYGPSLQRWNSGATVTNIALNIGGAAVQNDILRLAVDFTNSSQVTLIVSKNGTVIGTFTDNSANRLTGLAFPFICANSFGGAPNGQLKNFSCGIGL